MSYCVFYVTGVCHLQLLLSSDGCIFANVSIQLLKLGENQYSILGDKSGFFSVCFFKSIDKQVVY